MVELTYDAEDKRFYLLSNKHEDKFGVFLMTFRESDPDTYKFLLKEKHRLEIGNGDI